MAEAIRLETRLLSALASRFPPIETRLVNAGFSIAWHNYCNSSAEDAKNTKLILNDYKLEHEKTFTDIVKDTYYAYLERIIPDAQLKKGEDMCYSAGHKPLSLSPQLSL